MTTEMIWQTAVVRCDDQGGYWLEFSDPRSCGQCSRGTGCGAALFSRLFTRPDRRLRMPSAHKIPADRLVRAGLDPRWLMLAAATTYLLPAAAFVGGAVLADAVSPGSDPAALLAGVSLALVVMVLARYLLKSVSRPRLELVELHASLESTDDRSHFS